MLCKVKGSRKWYVRFTGPNGQRVLKTTGTESKELAREFAQQLTEKIWKEKKLGIVSRTWGDAVSAWALGKNISKQEWHLVLLYPYCHGRPLEQLGDVRDRLVSDRIDEAGNSTINRTLEVFRAVMKTAERKKWVECPEIEMLDEPPRSVRWITRKEADALLLQLPEHLKNMVQFALATGLRDSNVSGLEWSRVDLVRRIAWVDAADTKTKEPYHVPLNQQAVEVIRRCLGKHDRYVFTYQGHRVIRMNNWAWKKALKRAGIHNFRVHDLRHTWASWHVQNGTPLPVLKELGGWKTLSMVMRYAHLSKSHIADHADNICKPIIGESVKEMVEAV